MKTKSLKAETILYRMVYEKLVRTFTDAANNRKMMVKFYREILTLAKVGSRLFLAH